MLVPSMKSRELLRPGGILLLKIHHARYYLRNFWRGLISRRLLQMVHAGRVLALGVICHPTESQPDTRLIGNEIFPNSLGFDIERERPDSNPRTPAFIISKER